MAFSVTQEQWQGEPTCVLSGPGGEKATIVPGIGANLVELWLAPKDGQQPVQVMAAPPDVATLKQTPTRYGSPVLYPFPGRVKGGRFVFGGLKHQLDVYPDGNARHGYVLNQAFEITGQGAGVDGAWVSLTYNGDVAEIQRQYPYPFLLTLTFRLNARGLSVDISGKNTGGQTMPIGFGWHPYFNMPLGETGTRQECRLQVPADAYWELAEDLVPTGKREPVSGRLDLRSGLPVGDNSYDDILTNISRDARGWSHASLISPGIDATLTVSAGPTFREWVIYTPPGRSAVCLEPYTCTGNALNLQAAGFDAGLIALAPGECWTDTCRVELA